MTMGQRILTARLAAGMSQRELAGEEITRNMLSSLEHDTANPSVATLRYLSQRLGRPISWLLGEDEASGAIADFEAGRFRQCREQMTESERPWLEPLALLREAEQAIAGARLPYAATLLEQLEDCVSPFYGPELRRKAAILQCRCGKNADIPEDGSLLMKARKALAEQRPRDGARYLLAMDVRDPQWHRLMGECLLSQADYAGAKEHFHRCEADFDVRSRLELCYRELEDYRMAYFYAKEQERRTPAKESD